MSVQWKYGKSGEYAHIGPFKLAIVRTEEFWSYVITDRRDNESLTGGRYPTSEMAKADGVSYIDSLAD